MERETAKKHILWHRVVMAIIVILVAIMGLSWTYTELFGHETVVEEYHYQIHNGDTLWSIAEQYRNEDEDVREVYFNIKKDNNVEAGALPVGKVLVIKKEVHL